VKQQVGTRSDRAGFFGREKVKMSERSFLFFLFFPFRGSLHFVVVFSPLNKKSRKNTEDRVAQQVSTVRGSGWFNGGYTRITRMHRSEPEAIATGFSLLMVNDEW
jgi:hypothetical protein